MLLQEVLTDLIFVSEVDWYINQISNIDRKTSLNILTKNLNSISVNFFSIF